jgi:hypothetical protein
MKDPYQEMMEEVMSLSLFLICLVIAVMTQGCTQHEVKVSAPQLDKLITDCQKPTLAMPPIPETCIIDIRGDVMAASSKECEDLIRYYSRARSLLKPAAPLPAVQPAH